MTYSDLFLLCLESGLVTPTPTILRELEGYTTEDGFEAAVRSIFDTADLNETGGTHMYLLTIHKGGEFLGESTIALSGQSGALLARLIDAGYDLAITVAPDGHDNPLSMNGPNTPLRVSGAEILKEVFG